MRCITTAALHNHILNGGKLKLNSASEKMFAVVDPGAKQEKRCPKS